MVTSSTTAPAFQIRATTRDDSVLTRCSETGMADGPGRNARPFSQARSSLGVSDAQLAE